MNSLEAMKRAQTVQCKAGVKLLLIALAQDVRPKNGIEVWPGITTLAKRMGVDERTVQRRKAEAVAAGLIGAEPRQRAEGRGRTSDLIRLRFLTTNPTSSCRHGQRGTNPTNRDDQPDKLGATNPTTGVGGLEQEGSKKNEQEDWVTASLSPEQEQFLGHVGERVVSDSDYAPHPTSPTPKSPSSRTGRSFADIEPEPIDDPGWVNHIGKVADGAMTREDR